MIKEWAKTSLKNIPLTLFVTFACERVLETEQRLQHIDLTSPSGHSRVSFSFSWCSTGGPGAQLSAECWLFFHILSPMCLQNYWENRGSLLLGVAFPTTSCITHLISDFIRGPEGPLRQAVALSTTSYSNLSGPQLTDFLSWPSYIYVQSPTQSPTQSLEWHVWSSSSGNYCHAVQRSLSSGVSVYECIMGFYLVPFRQPNPPTRFLRLLAIGMCHFLPVHHFGMACLPGPKVNI